MNVSHMTAFFACFAWTMALSASPLVSVEFDSAEPRIEAKVIDESTFDLGKIPAGTELDLKLRLRNRSKSALSFARDIKASCGCTRAVIEESGVASGASTVLKAHLKASKSGGAIRVQLIASVTGDSEKFSIPITLVGDSVPIVQQFGALTLVGSIYADSVHAECRLAIARSLAPVNPIEVKLLGLQLPEKIFDVHVALESSDGLTNNYKVAVDYHPRLDSDKRWREQVVNARLMFNPAANVEADLPVCFNLRGNATVTPSTVRLWSGKGQSDQSAIVTLRGVEGGAVTLVGIRRADPLDVTATHLDRTAITLKVSLQNGATVEFKRQLVFLEVLVDGKEEQLELPVVTY